MIRGLCRDDVTFAASVKLRHVTASRWPRSVLRFWWVRMHHTLMVISDEPDSMMSPVTSLPLSTVQRSWSESSDSEDEEPKLFRLVDCGLVVARWCWPPSRSGTYKQTTWPSWPRRMASHRPERCEIATIKSKQIWSIGQYGWSASQLNWSTLAAFSVSENERLTSYLFWGTISSMSGHRSRR